MTGHSICNSAFKGCDYPRFSGGDGLPNLVTLHHAHYARLEAIRKAAETGNDILIQLALEAYRQYGSTDQ